MTSYFSSLTSSSAISNLGTRLNSLRRAIISGEEVDDLDNEDCSHVSNVLRAYYVEKGRPFPPWLPPDPKAPAPPPSRVVATTQIQPGGYAQAHSTSSSSSLGRGGGLSDLWGDGASPQPPPPQVASLRRGRPGMPPNPAHSAPPASGGMPMNQGPAPPSSHPAGARPLPSQRGGTYQPMQPSQPSQPSQLAPTRAPLDRAPSAQDRLRARLHGGRSPSPSMGGGRPGSPYYGGDPSARKPVGMGFRG